MKIGLVLALHMKFLTQKTNIGCLKALSIRGRYG